jgi:hypothetical protein
MALLISSSVQFSNRFLCSDLISLGTRLAITLINATGSLSRIRSIAAFPCFS